MKQFGSVEEILDFAINEEEGAYQFYMGLAKKAKNDNMREAFEEFAREEQGHKARLQSIKSGKQIFDNPTKTVTDMKLSDYLVDVEPSDDMDYQSALIVAMKKEKAAFRLYMDLANQVSDPGLQGVFKSLAQEEAKHKLRFEIEYDDNVFTEM